MQIGRVQIRCLVALAFFVLLRMIGTASAQDSEAQGTVLLKVERSNRWIGKVANIVVWVNGDRIGKVPNGESAEFKIYPTADGKNKFSCTVESVFGELVKSSSATEFTAFPGGIVKATVACVMDDVEAKITVEKAGNRPVGKLAVSIDPDVIERVVSSDVVTTLPGSKQTYKRSRTIERSISLTESKSLEVTAGIDLKIISSTIRGEIERQLSQTYRQIETVERSIEIDGNTLPRVRLVWIERYRRGTARGVFGSTESDLPFYFPLELELRPVRVAERSYVELTTNLGKINLELFEDEVPVATRNFLDNVMTGQYDGTIFDQVVPDVAVAGGYYTKDFSPKSPEGTIKCERIAGLFNRSGTIGMLPIKDASSRSHFYINLSDNTQFDAPADGTRYTPFGRVINGVEVLEKMKAVATQKNPKTSRKNSPVSPIEIVRARHLSAEEAKASINSSDEVRK